MAISSTGVCPKCARGVQNDWRVCPACAAPLHAVHGERETETVVTPQFSSSGTLDEGRFPAGTVLAERYRIIGLLGQGGMGEVYRANDLKLGQPVALKFLPAATAKNQQLLARFHAEVRIARQVSHPNVCRVYDIGEVDGSTFLSMEYVDGEDLRSLLRRIGRLPGDKAMEIARKLCAGLAAAHDKGVLHRDLKPANIMIDGRGQVLITDFGLAALAGQLDGAHLRDGTPAYMAPEQLAGKEVSVRSDIYALGLVLHEMFTGKRAFENGSERTTPTSVTSLAKDIDPLVERVILRCLDVDPRNRPASALAVAAALPGGDPLAAALAAGDTPTPGMVAASEDTGALSVRAAVVCMALIVGGLAGVVAISPWTNITRVTPFPNSPEVLAGKARDLTMRFGYTDPPADSHSIFFTDTDYLQYARQELKAKQYLALLARGQPPLIGFLYRQSPQYLATLNTDGDVSGTDPPPVLSGMVEVRLDPLGRLTDFTAVPSQLATEKPAAHALDWDALFAAAGLDKSRFKEAEPERLPLVSFDVRAAWVGSYEAAAPSLSLPVRVEAAAWRGRPVYYQILGPWTTPDRIQPRVQETVGQRAFQWFWVVVLSAVCPAAALLAWRNYHRKRSDVRGASRLAAFAFSCQLAAWFFTAHHVPSAEEFFGHFFPALSEALFWAVAFWVLYVALEPYVRRRWPQSLISWNRLLAGGVRDPLVGGHLLAGIALGVGYALYFGLEAIALPTGGVAVNSPAALLGADSALGAWFGAIIHAITLALVFFFLFFLLRTVLRRNWLAAACFVAVTALLGFIQPGNRPLVFAAFAALQIGSVLYILIRWGVLPMSVGILVGAVPEVFPMTSDFSAWYASMTIFALTMVLLPAAWSFRNALGARKLWREGFLDG